MSPSVLFLSEGSFFFILFVLYLLNTKQKMYFLFIIYAISPPILI